MFKKGLNLEEFKKDLIDNYRTCGASHFIKKYDVSLSMVDKYVFLLKLTSKYRYLDNKEAIIKDYLDGDSLSVLASRYGHGSGNISKKLVEWGIQKRNSSESRSTYDVDSSIFQEINSHEKAYWLGFLYADGNIYLGPNGEKYVLQLCLAKKDKTHVEAFRAFLKSTHPLYVDRQAIRLCVNNISIIKDLVNLGCTPRKSLTLKFPQESQLKKEYYCSFILGYFDGDGSICTNKWKKGVKMWKFQLMGTIDFNSKIQEILIECAGLGKTKLTIEKRGNGNVSYLNYGGVLRQTSDPRAKHSLLYLYKYLYSKSPIWLKRKKNRFQSYLKIRYPNDWK